jgi:hypothetical protein
MPRRNNGARLFWREDRGAYYIGWTERGRSRKLCSGTADCAEAQIVLAEWLQGQARKHGPSDPSQVLITDVLNAYALERGPKVACFHRVPYQVCTGRHEISQSKEPLPLMQNVPKLRVVGSIPIARSNLRRNDIGAG